MKTYIRMITLVLAIALIICLAVWNSLEVSVGAAGTTYYVDCVNGNDSNNGTTTSTPWKTLSKVSSVTYVAGDSILLKRGVTCSGMLTLKGSGTASSPITLGAYNTGALPIVNGGTNSAAIKINAYQGWHIENLEVTGGNPYGINVTGTRENLSHFRVTNVVIHDVGGTATNKASGLLDISIVWTKTGTIDDVIIDGVTAYNTAQWRGIHVGCGGKSMPAGNANPIIIRNSTVHTTNGDGVTIYDCNNGLIENTVAYDTGNTTTASPGTPNSTWTFACQDCTVQHNEAYLADSPLGAGDGGAFDIDWNSANTLVQYNYAHDNIAFCVAFYGAEGYATTDSVFRYNICSNNGQRKSLFGEYYASTWTSGWLDGVKIYNNTTYWNPYNDPVWELPAICFGCIPGWEPTFSGTRPNLFKNNIVYSEWPYFLWRVNSSMVFDNNIYWYTGAGSPRWVVGAPSNLITYTTFSAYQTGTGQEANSLYTNPLVNNVTYHDVGMPTTAFTLQAGSPARDAGANVGSMGSHDFFGGPIPYNSVYDIGAHEYGSVGPTAIPTNTPSGPTPTPTNTPSGPTATPGSSTVMHVADIYTTDSAGTPKDTFNCGDTIYWRAKIVDGNNSPVNGAAVTTKLLKPDQSTYATVNGTTGTDGWATFSKGTKGPDPTGTWSVTVYSVTRSGYTYDPNANAKTTHQFTMQ